MVLLGGALYSEEHLNERATGGGSETFSSSFTFTPLEGGRGEKCRQETIFFDSKLDAGDDEEVELKKMSITSEEVEAMLAGRNIGWVVGPFTMTGT